MYLLYNGLSATYLLMKPRGVMKIGLKRTTVLINRPKPSDLLWPDWKYVKTIGGSYVFVATKWESCE